MFDESGREVGTGSGERGQVKIDTPGLQGTTLVHNHPDGSETLSMQDLQFARSKNLGEIRSITPGGEVFTAKRPEKGWPSEEGIQKTHDQILKVKISDGTVGKIKEQFQLGKLTAEEASIKIGESVMPKVMNKLGMT